MSDTHCTRCNAPFPAPPPTSGAAGYAITRAGARICYPCADATHRAEVAALEPGESFTCYLSSDGKTITTCTGGALATVTELRPVKAGGFIPRYAALVSVHAVTPQGVHLYGRGAGKGMCITMRGCKPR